jgi:phosphoglycolate phosphatase-like HAD superfamily hydrolase
MLARPHAGHQPPVPRVREGGYVTAAEWLATAGHPRFDRPYTELACQPILELLAYLRDQGFKTFIVSGGGIEFTRVFTERVDGGRSS